MLRRDDGSTVHRSFLLVIMSFDDVTTYKNLLRAGEQCCNGGRWKSHTQMFEISILQRTAENRKKLLSGQFAYHKTNDFKLCERGKWRNIQAHYIGDRQVQKAFCKYELIPSVQNRILPNNAASQNGKGTDFMIAQFRQDLAHAYKVCGGRQFYVITYDFHNYFGSIPHDQSLQMLCAGLHDARSQKLLTGYANNFSDNAGYGIGGEPSQVIAVVYPSPIDRMLACDPDVIRSSGRYMDDGYIIVRTLDAAHRVIAKYRTKAEQMGLIVNEKRLQIYNMSKDVVTFLKKRTSITESGKIVMRLTRENVRNEIRRIKYHKKEYDAGRMPMYAIEQSIQCWISYASKYNSYKARIRVLDFYAKIFNIPWDVIRKRYFR